MRWRKAYKQPPGDEKHVSAYHVRYTNEDGETTKSVIVFRGKHGFDNFPKWKAESANLEWLDESLPASIEDEANALYPDGQDWQMVTGTEKQLSQMLRSAHITCAGMYTGEIERLKDVLHIDQTGLAAGLSEVNKITEGYRWVTEGRGPYAWNDDKYKEEMGNMLDNISEAATKSLNSSGAIAHSVCCGKEGRTATMEGIGYIKKDFYDREIERLKAENSKMRQALEGIANPVEYLRKQAEAEGGHLDGSGAIALSNDPAFLKTIAAKSLNEL